MIAGLLFMFAVTSPIFSGPGPLPPSSAPAGGAHWPEKAP